MGFKEIFGAAIGSGLGDNYEADLQQMRAMYELEARGLTNTTASMMNAQQNAQQNSLLASAYANSVSTRQGAYAPPAAPDSNPNEDPAYTPALSVVKGMWQVKWGDAWIQATILRKEDAFWESAKERLWHADLLERTDGRSYWYRIKE